MTNEFDTSRLPDAERADEVPDRWQAEITYDSDLSPRLVITTIAFAELRDLHGRRKMPRRKIEKAYCVRLHGAQVMIALEKGGWAKYSMHVRKEDGTLRPLTRDEELVIAAAPGTSAERRAAERRFRLPPEGSLKMMLRPQPWLPGEKEEVFAQMERDNADTDALH